MNPASIIRKLNLALLLVALACACALSPGLARTAWAGEDGPPKDIMFASSEVMASSNDDIKGSNWMSVLSDDVALSDLSIPGTHDSGTWITWDGLFYSICQSFLLIRKKVTFANTEEAFEPSIMLIAAPRSARLRTVEVGVAAKQTTKGRQP